MSVEFPGEQYNQGTEFNTPKESTMVKWVMKSGLVKNEQQANYVLLGLAIVFFAITWWVIAGSGTPTPKTTYLEDIPVADRANIPPEILKTIPSRNQ